MSDATPLTFKASYDRLYDEELSRALYYQAGSDEYDDAGRLVLTEPGTASAERSERVLKEGNVMELEGPLTMAAFGVGPLVDVSVTGAPYAPSCR